MNRPCQLALAAVLSSLTTGSLVTAWFYTHGPNPVVTVAASAEDMRRPVWITRTGNRFHREDCPHARSAGMRTTAEAAMRKGYKPCKTCRP